MSIWRKLNFLQSPWNLAADQASLPYPPTPFCHQSIPGNIFYVENQWVHHTGTQDDNFYPSCSPLTPLHCHPQLSSRPIDGNSPLPPLLPMDSIQTYSRPSYFLPVDSLTRPPYSILPIFLHSLGLATKISFVPFLSFFFSVVFGLWAIQCPASVHPGKVGMNSLSWHGTQAKPNIGWELPPVLHHHCPST